MTHQHDHGDKKFDPTGKERLDSPDRKLIMDPDKIIPQLDILDGQLVADIGAGTGYFSVPFSDAVSPRGKVYAIDISQSMLDSLVEKAESRGIRNIAPVLSEEDTIPIDDGIVGLAFMSMVLHELDGDETLQETYRILKQGGRLAILDYKKIESEHGPPLWHRLSQEEAIEKCEKAGFTFSKIFDTSPDMYGLVFEKI